MSEFLSFHLPDDFIEEYVKVRPNWGFDIGGGNSLAELTFITKYSRLKSDGTKERWHECCRRCIEGMFSILKDHCKSNRTPWNEHKAQRSARSAFDRMFNFKWTPPGRGLWMMGTEFVHVEKNSAALQNCGMLSTEKISTRSVAEAIYPFVRLMDMSMHGIGVGFDSRGAGKLVLHERSDEEAMYVVDDSREGWVESVGILLESFFFEGRPVPVFDYSNIRPAGEPLKRFGGTAAGPGPLIQLHEALTVLLDGRAGESLGTIDIGDIMNLIGKCVVAGSIRRSAEIWFGDSDDKEFLDAKDPSVYPERTGPNGWAYLSNNSVFAETGENYDHLVDRIARNGEPGLLYLDLARQYGRMADPPDGRDHRIVGANPCVTGDAWVLTANGPRRAKDLVGLPVDVVVDGKPFPVTSNGFFETGTKPVFNLMTDEGWSVKLTEDHKVKTVDGWMSACELTPGQEILLHDHDGFDWGGAGSWDDGYVLGLYLGDGTASAQNGVKLSTWDADLGSGAMRAEAERIVASMPHRSDWRGWAPIKGRGEWRMHSASLTRLAEEYGMYPQKGVTAAVEMASSDFQRGFVRGLFDTDGHVEGDGRAGVSIRLSQSSLPTLEAVQRMLGRLGIRSVVRDGQDARTTLLPDGRGGRKAYDCKKGWRLILTGAQAARYMTLVGFTNTEKRDKWYRLTESMPRGFYHKPNTARFLELRPAGVEVVYDVSVEDVHAFDANGLYVHNCSEQSLEHGELCCLVETFPHHHESYDDFEETLKAAYLYAKAVTLLPTGWPESNEIMQRNRRIGCSVTGVAQFVESRGIGELREWLDQGYAFVCKRDAIYSEWLGIRESIKKTSVKPSGTVSLVGGATPGAHWPTGPSDGSTEYIRRQRFAKLDPLVAEFERVGYHVEPDFMDPDYTVVVEFPTRGIPVRTESQVSVWEKAMLAATLQRYWADNQVSCTLTFRPDEVDQVGPLIHNFDGQLKSLSLLPLLDGGAYKQMPYEGLPVGEWDKMASKVKSLNWKKIYGGAALDGQGERFCANDVCEIL